MPKVLSVSTIAANDAIEKLRQQTTDKWNNRKYTKSIIAIIDALGIKEWFRGDNDEFNWFKNSYAQHKRSSSP